MSSLEARDSLVAPLWTILIEGSHICRAALLRECFVTSISRSGKSSITHENIAFEKANIFSPEQYRGFLRDAAAVIYSAGVLLERDYKPLAQGKFEPSQVVALLRQRSRNPLDADPNNSTGYNALNRDGGEISFEYLN